jgi:serine/threonine-protein kinase RsbW
VPRTRSSPPPLDRRKLVLRYRRRLASTREAINGAVHEVIRQLRSCCDDHEDMADIEISLREALANAILHGNRRDPSRTVLLRVYGGPGQALLIAVRDEGEGFDPSDVPDPREAERLHLDHGRGIFLMRELMDHVEHRRGGKEVVLVKRPLEPGTTRYRAKARRRPKR